MKCLFCPTIELGVRAFDEPWRNTHKCNRCGTAFTYHQNELRSWRFFKKLNGKIFCVDWGASWNKIQVYSTSPYKEVIVLEGDVNINPHNIATKLPMLVIFS